MFQKRIPFRRKKCEEHFIQNTTRNKTGRFVVALPFKNNVCELGESKKKLALKFLHRLLERFKVDKKFEKKYTRVMEEYIELGHMSPNKEPGGFYLPDLPVEKISSNTTKLRVVFHASAKSSNKKSINDNLMTGPTIQDDLFTHLIRFRTLKYVIMPTLKICIVSF